MDNIKAKIQFVANLYRSKKLFQAEIEAKKLLREHPKIVFLYNILGLILSDLKKFDDAIVCFERGLTINPNNIDNALIYNNLGSIYLSRDNYLESEICFKKSANINKKMSEPLNNLGNLYLKANNYKDGINSYKKAISINHNFFPAHYNIGIAYKNIGDFANAKLHLEITVDQKKDFYSAHRSLSEIIKYDKKNTHLEILENIYLDKEIKKEKKTELIFALGKAYDDKKDFKKAFSYYKEANELRKAHMSFSKEKIQKEFNDIKNTFDKNFVNKMNTKNPNSSLIFVLGMPRSGTTLTEQILSSHPDVYGADELNLLPDLIDRNFSNISSFNNSSPENLNLIFSEYLNYVKKISNSSKIITDKLPINFKWIGLIKTIFPKSKVIHCKRNSKDVCISIFKNYFTNKKLNFAYDLNDIVSFYNLYIDLMQHWKKQFPDFIVDIIYEDLIVDPNKEIKKLVQSSNLKWNDNCLKFYENSRPIKTASDTQVRTKIYSKSVNSWKNYEIQLRNVFSALTE
jgi:tetratricopeptide (TPR) repeat protein